MERKELGYINMTVEERKEYNKKYYLKNKDKLTAQHVKWRTENRQVDLEYKRKYSLENKHIMKAADKKFRENHPEKTNAKAAKRRAAKQKATPSWLSKEQLEQIEALYYKAKELEKSDGICRHVDHIVPLRGSNVSGLHVPWNLQILTASENVSKGNRVTN